LSDLDVRSYLRGKGLETRTSGKEVIVPCFFLCGEPGNSRKKKLYISSEHGAHSCKVCGTEGGWRAILEHFGDQIEGTAAAKPSRRLAINEEYVRACQDALMRNKAALTYLFDRGLTLETIETARLGYAPKNVAVVEGLPSALKPGGFTRQELRDSGLLTASGKDFHSGRLIIPYLSSGQVLQVRGRALDPADKIKYATPPGEPVRLYNSDALRGAESALICEGEIDLLVLQQTLQSSPDVRARNIGVVAIPGAQSLPGGKEEFADYFEDVRRVYIGFDNDNAGKQGAVKVKDLMGTKGRIVELTGDDKDWAEYIVNGTHGWQDVMSLVVEADMRGKRVFSVGESLLSLRKLEQAAPGIKTGFATLDALIAPGLLPGQVTVPVAKSGNGKSVFLANICWYTRDIPSMMLTLELTKEETAKRLLRIGRFHDPVLDERALDQAFPLLAIVDENRLGPEDFDVLIEEYAEQHGERPRLIHVDYLGYYSRGQHGKDQYEKSTNAIMQLKEMAKKHQVHVIVPSQVNRGQKQGELIDMDSMRDSGAVEETADFIFGISRPHMSGNLAKATGNGSVAAEMKVNLPKSRHGNANRVVSVYMGPHSLAIVDGTDRKAVAVVEQEVDSYNRGETYPEYLARRQKSAWLARQGELDTGGAR